MIDERLRQLINKYDRPGPRYTSYPMAPEWSDIYGPEDFAAVLDQASARTEEPLSIYVHKKKKKKLCWFCGCNKVISSDQAKAGVYLDCLEREIDIVCGHLGDRRSVTQVHFGGGTPSLLSLEHTRRASAMLTERFSVQEPAEVAMEIDPRTTDFEKILLLKELGFNRLSFGVQDLDDNVQQAIHRGQTEKETRALFDFCRREGFEGLNFDLVYGLPRQRPETFGRMIDRVIEMCPDRIALYSFAHIPTLLPAQKLLQSDALPDPVVKLELLLLARERFLANDYVQIGMDHFVRPHDELAQAQSQGRLRRNFMGYTVKAAADWLGFGVSAISYIHHHFAQNRKVLKEYQQTVAGGRFATERGMALSRDDILRQTIITEMMCNFRVDFDRLSEPFEIDWLTTFASELSDLEEFVSDGLVRRQDSNLEVTEQGQLFVRNIAMTFDAYLRKGPQQRTFSRTV